MTCPKCQASVPDESLFCLRCGTRLQAPAERAPLNGGGSAKAGARVPATSATPTAPATVAAPAATAPPGGKQGKQAYTLSFKPLSDERMRYRVARWVCELAPAHVLSEVQEDLTRGQFATFLALTHEEAEAARQRIQALGAHPGLWRLSPATAADMLVADRPERKAKAEWSPQKKFAAIGIGLLALFLFGALAAQRYYNAAPVGPQPGTMPTIGGKP